MNQEQLGNELAQAEACLKLRKKLGTLNTPFSTFFFDLEQGTDEWKKIRKGLFTATDASVFLTSAFTSTGKAAAGSIGIMSKGLVTTCIEVAAAKVMTNIDPSFKGVYMQMGNDREPFALAEYCNRFDVVAVQCGFVQKNGALREWAGCSPDTLILDSGNNVVKNLEIKCPTGETHLTYLMNPEALYEDYMPQLQWQMWVCGTHEADLISFHPHFPEDKQMLVYKVKRDPDVIKVFEEKIYHAAGHVKNILTGAGFETNQY